MSKRVFIVGGGESLKGFDFNRLAGEDVIAINLAYQFIKPKILLWMDRSFYEHHKEGIDQLKCIKYAPDNVIATDWTEDIRAFRTGYQFKGKEGFHKGIYAGNPASTLSGLASISLAFALGYEEVFLLGFDGSQKHFHNGYKVEKDISHKNVRYRDLRGLKIYNCSLISKIDAFPKISIDDAFSGNIPEMPTKQDDHRKDWIIRKIPLIKKGLFREVYRYGEDEILKIERKVSIANLNKWANGNKEYSANLTEWQNWLKVKGTELEKYFCPCVAYSREGLIMKRAKPLDKSRTDEISKIKELKLLGNEPTYEKNLGMYQDRVVCFDYQYEIGEELCQ